jgi:nucleolar GTP-binding protein
MISSAKPEIAEYPFTTKAVSIGHFMHEGRRYQVIDIPGLLDRPLSKRNKIELQAISALRHLGDVILFILDPSETCGYSLTSQKHLLNEIKRELKTPVLVVANKCDLEGVRGAEADMLMSHMSAETGEGIAEVKARLIEMLKERRRQSTQP